MSNHDMSKKPMSNCTYISEGYARLFMETMSRDFHPQFCIAEPTHLDHKTYDIALSNISSISRIYWCHKLEFVLLRVRHPTTSLLKHPFALGCTSPLLGCTSPLLGCTNPLLGCTSPLLGRTSPLLGRTSPLLGRTSP